MQREVFDQFPWSARLYGVGTFAFVAMLVVNFMPNRTAYAAIPVVLGVLCPFVRDVLIINFDRGTWSYRRGLWPILMIGTTGGFEDLYGIEISVVKFENRSSENSSSDGIYVSDYTSSMFFKDDSIGKQALYTGRSFGEVAEPTCNLAHALKLPVMLSPDIRDFDTRLAEYQSQAQSASTIVNQ